MMEAKLRCDGKWVVKGPPDDSGVPIRVAVFENRDGVDSEKMARFLAEKYK